MRSQHVFALFTALLGSNVVYAIPATATFLYAGGTQVPGLSNYYSFSQVNSGGSETTYVEEYRISLRPPAIVAGETQAVPLNTTVTGLATLVQSSGGYWESQDYTGFELTGTATSWEAVATGNQVQSCAFDANKEAGSCILLDAYGGTTITRNSWSGTVVSVIRTDVGEPSGAENGAAMPISGMTQMGVVAAAMAVGVVLVL